jgi:dihydrofolate synthase/folylpolyglutamate synthase
MDPLAFLFSLERLGMKFGLENMRALCDALGNPELAFRSVIVGGTNGKGSVTAMTSAALHAAGHRSARYTSPHLERLEERFVIGEREVSTSALRTAAATVQAVVGRLIDGGVLSGPPTFFECATAIAFELFRTHGVGVAVLEVGLGGRLDATNVVSPAAAAITSIDFDHQAQLGNDLTSIAREKAGIIKPGIPVVCGPLPIEADRVMVDTCRERGAHLVRALERVAIETHRSDGEPVVRFRSPANDFGDVRLALRGNHQVANAAVAITLLEEINALGIDVSRGAILAGLAGVEWPARLELRTWHDAEVLLDAAHNPAGARALASYLIEAGWTGRRRPTLVVGMMRDKDVAGVLSALLPACARVICTTAITPRALTAEELAGRARSTPGAPLDIDAIDDPAAALWAACQPGAHVVIAGSIFLVGPLRGILR